MIKNKNILITGGNSGIGFFAIINLLKTKNILYVLIKNEFRKNEFLKKIEKYFDKNYLSKFLNIIENCDLSDLENIKEIYGTNYYFWAYNYNFHPVLIMRVD